MKHTKRGGFTFVELVVVVVILGVLATVGILSYTTYLTGARDSNRVTQLSDLRGGLSLYSATKKLPSPEDNIQISAGGTVIGYQGYAGEQVLKSIGYNDGGTDPLDNTYFTYYMSVNARDFQLMAFLEEEPEIVTASLLTQSYAEDIDYTERYPTVAGKPLGTLIYTQDGSNRPVQEALTSVNVSSTTETFRAYYSDEEILSGTGGVLTAMIPNKSCKRIQELGNHNGSGIYKINPTGANEFQAYCDMETDGGGWTFFGHFDSTSDSSSGSSGFFNSDSGDYDPTRTDTDSTYNIDASVLDHTEMMVTLDSPNSVEAELNSKIVFYKYEKNTPAFYTGPIPCVGLNGAFSYKITSPSKYTPNGTSNACGANWYTRDAENIGYLTLFHSTADGNYWGASMGGNNTWGHDGWWYVR